MLTFPEKTFPTPSLANLITRDGLPFSDLFSRFMRRFPAFSFRVKHNRALFMRRFPKYSFWRHRNSAVISVTDHGCGIPAENQPRIFERFYRVHKERSRALGGTGLGLAIVKHIAQLHGGRAELDSESGKGCCFKIVLPENNSFHRV